ncbi:hypothetical protein FXV77_07320 [Sphingobacterium phlebotomi]|uniref:Fimbrillin-like protein n=1 Tax=Sphingobacterium phlebotomi TaxID=2605433 RepID=A0A5D4H847_9SPHI|nr:hypothetical protein [Sphingobacterium phlebotomi]TYR36976.1 hypothetical protein FXV77_07320 [Sphingobacterium phlebotomi]
MKIFFVNLGKLATGVLLALGTIFAAGCAKDDKGPQQEEGTRLVVRIAGINEGAEALASKAKASSNSRSLANQPKTKLIQTGAFDVLISTDDKTEPKSKRALGRLRSASSGSGAFRGEAMPQGYTYRIFLYKEDGTFVHSEQFNSGTAGSIPLSKGESYSWYTVSCNNADPVADRDANNHVALPQGEDILYAKGSFSVSTEPGDVVVPLDITFSHRLTRVEIELNTMGMFAPMQSAAIEVKGLHLVPQGMDIVSGDFVGEDEQDLTIDYSTFVDVDEHGDRKVVYAYLGGNTTEEIEVNVSQLQIQLDNGETRNFGDATLSHRFLPEPGMNQRVRMGFVESPQWLDIYGQGRVYWARSNLYYQEGHNPYRFYPLNALRDDSQGYFSFKGHLPLQLADKNNSKDPCALVYPAGLWKQPSLEDIRMLTNAEVLVSNILNGTVDHLVPGTTSNASETPTFIRYNQSFGTPPPSEVYPEENDKITAFKNGIGVSTTPFGGGVHDISFGGTYSMDAGFWTHESGLDLLESGAQQLGAWAYHGRTRYDVNGARSASGNRSVDLINEINVGGRDLLTSVFMNVRCVRDSTWDPETPGYDPNPDLSNL